MMSIGNIIFPAILFFLAIFHLTDQFIELTDENGTEKFVSPEFFVPKQCYGAMGEFAPGSYRIQFRVVGQGHCQLLLCYPSQLDPYVIPNGIEPEIGYYLPNNLESNAWMEKCPVTGDNEKWHGIYVDVDIDIINLTLSFSTQRFPVKRDFIIELANPSHSSITTKLHIFNLDSEQFEIKEFGNDEQILQQFLGFQHRGASLADFAGLWALALDMLPSDLNQNKIKMFTWASKYNSHPGEHNNTCDVDSGKMVEDNCHIQAWFLEPDDKLIENQITENATNNSSIMDMKLPFIDESLLEYPLQINDTIHITGWVNDKTQGYFRIHLLHNWTEPDPIMGETILSILVRRNYINFESKYNFTKYEQPIGETITNKIGKSLEKNIDQKFSLDIVVDENGNFNLTLNCKENAFVFKQTIDPLKYASIDYILIEADSGWELNNYQIKKNMNGPLKPTILPNSNNKILPFSDPSYSIKLDYPTDERDFYIIVKLEILENATKFDINLVLNDGQQNKAEMLVHFHANLNDNFYLLGSCSENCSVPIWSDDKTIFNASSIVKQLNAGQQFFWIWLDYYIAPIFIDNTEIGQMSRKGMAKKPNYIQFKGDIRLLNFSVEPRGKIYILESAFKPFNQIKFVLNLLGNKGVKIEFGCLDKQKCEERLNSMQLYIDENYVYLLSSNYQKVEKKLNNMLYNQTLNLSLYANQFEYRIFNGDELILIRNYWQFPTPDKFDVFAIDGFYILPDGEPRKEWKQNEMDIALPFTYILDKQLEIGSSIKIKMKFQVKNIWTLKIYLQNNAYEFYEHFGTNVLLMDIYAYNFFIDKQVILKDSLDIKVGQKIKNKNEYIIKNTTIHEFGDFFEIEIIIFEEYYQIKFDGMEMFNISHIVPFKMVDFMRIENNADAQMQDKIIEAKITWPSDSSSKWLTAPGKTQIELIGPSNLPVNKPLIMLLNRPLRINDTIMFKGKFYNGLKELRTLFIELSRNNTKDETFKILKVHINYGSESYKDSKVYLYRDEYDKNGKLVRDHLIKNFDYDFTIPSNDEFDFDVKIRIEDKSNFNLQFGNSTGTSIKNNGLFWAIQYIKLYFKNGWTVQNIEMAEGYPKIMHQYENY